MEWLESIHMSCTNDKNPVARFSCNEFSIRIGLLVGTMTRIQLHMTYTSNLYNLFEWHTSILLNTSTHCKCHLYKAIVMYTTTILHLIKHYLNGPKKAPKGAMSQDKIFYTAKWTKEVDHKFIEVLVSQAAMGNFQLGRSNTHAILITMVDINRQFQTNFNYHFCVDRLKKLHKCYWVFNWITSLSGVYYNLYSSKVEYDQALWDYMCRVSFIQAHYIM